MNKYSPINLDYFLDMEIANGGLSKQVITLNGKLKTIKDLVKYWSTASKPKLTPETWQYYNCMVAGFRKGVDNHHDIGWDKLTEEYYNSLEPMSDRELGDYLQANPVEFNNGFIKHSYHRALAMVGRLIRGEKYIPFYMETSQIYDLPRKLDGIIRTTKLTSKLKHLSLLDKMGISRDEYCICQSGILSVMGIRDNDDLDIIVSSKLRNQNISYPPSVEVFDKDRKKFDYFGASGDDNILKNYCITIDGYKFLEPRFYFARKHINKTLRDITDWEEIYNFFKQGLHKGYPFNFEFYKWGLPYASERVNLSDLDLKSMTLVKDKYNRIVNNINQGRAVYKGNGYYVKIFHPQYCRLNHFKEALSSGFLNGLTPSLTHLITDNNEIIGYITLSGKHSSNVPPSFIRTILKNCKQRNKLFYDLVDINIIKDDYYGEWSLIDLESVYDLSDLSDMKPHNAQIKPLNLIELINNI
jgi:hypothetical protein|tara:strand:- start:1451 stop:2860 length:1410 start_codon:yes stop_codon:yes gene_type:complete